MDETKTATQAKSGASAKRLRRKPAEQKPQASAADAASAGEEAPLTAVSVAAMDEATLRRRVLIRLFEALDYDDVREWHGADELGKDIVAWRTDEGGQRRPVAIVAKATALTGKAAPRIPGSAAEAAFQVGQCFGDHPVDPRTGKKHPVERCYVITNKLNKGTGIKAFWAALQGFRHADQVELWDGKQLWEKVRRHLPRELIDLVAEAREVAENFPDPQYRIDFASDATGVTFSIRERYAGAWDERPLTIGIADGPGAAEAAAAQWRVAAEDAMVVLEGEAARAVLFPEEFRPLIPDEGLTRVWIDLPERLETYSVDLRLDDGTGSPLVVGPLAMDLHQIAGARARFTNRHQIAPPLRCWYDTDLAPAPDGGVLYTTGTLHYGPGSLNVDDRRTVARLRAKLQRPCTLRLIDRATRQVLVEAQLPAETPLPGLDSVLLLCDGLAALQDRTGVPIAVPDDLSADMLAVLRALATIALTGSLVETWDALALPVPVANINPELLAALLEGGTVSLGLSGQAEERLGDGVIPLGEQRVALASARLTNADEILEALTAGAPKITLRLAPGDDATAVRRYTDWLPRDENKTMAGTLPKTSDDDLSGS